MVWQLLSMFSPFLLPCQTTVLLVEKWSATEAEQRNPFCTEQTHKQTKKMDSICASIQSNSFHPDYGNSYWAEEHWQIYLIQDCPVTMINMS